MGSMFSPSQWIREPGNPSTADESACLLTSIRIKAAQLTQLVAGESRRAVVCHDYVRSLKLQMGRHLGRGAAVAMTTRAGTALDKCDLLIALLRCSGITARLRLYIVRSEVFRGLRDDEPPGTLHPVVECFVNARWVAVDTFQMDVALALGARVKLLNEHARWGYGIHLNGAVNWDGCCDAYCFLHHGDTVTAPVRDCGTFNSMRELLGFATAMRDLSQERAKMFEQVKVNGRAARLRNRA